MPVVPEVPYESRVVQQPPRSPLLYPAADLLEEFHRIDLVYKTLDDGNVALGAAVLIPKSLVPTPDKAHPVLVHIHGGALITGTNPDPSFLSRWLVSLALTTPAIMVSPAYRLLPESTGSDILDDLFDFWTWLHTSFPATLKTHVSDLIPDLARVALAGESAGGYLSLQSAFLFPHAHIKVVMASYPAQYPDIAAYNPRPTPDLENNANPDPDAGKVLAMAELTVDQYLVRAEQDKRVRVSSPWPEKEDLIRAMCRTGRHREMMGPDQRLTARGALQGAGMELGLPAIWLIQGDEDDLVPKEAADELVVLIEHASPETPLKYTVEPGGHTFDLECGLDVAWVKEGIEFVNKFWP